MAGRACACCGSPLAARSGDALCSACRRDVREREFLILDRYAREGLGAEPDREDYRRFLLSALPQLKMDCAFVPLRRDEVAALFPPDDGFTLSVLDGMARDGELEDAKEGDRRVGVLVIVSLD